MSHLQNRCLKFLKKLKKKQYFFLGGGGGGGQGGGGGFGLGGGQGGCERRIEVFVKIQKKNWEGGGGLGRRGVGLWGVRPSAQVS